MNTNKIIFMLQNQLEQYILATLSYFDIFEFPLTLFEIRKNLVCLGDGLSRFPSNPPSPPCQGGMVRCPSLIEVENVLNSDELGGKIEEKNGFYFLKGRSHYLTRQRRYYFAEKKFKRAKKIAWILSKVPFVKMIAVCNSLGYSNTKEGSDIDFFIVASKNRVWSARLLSVFLIKLLNLRPKEGSVKDTICMPFFVDEENLNLERFRIDERDVYLRFWTTQLVPIYDQGSVYEKFWDENRWVEGWLPNRVGNEIVCRRKIVASRYASQSFASILRRGIKGFKTPQPPSRRRQSLWRRTVAKGGIIEESSIPPCQGGVCGLNKNSVQVGWFEKLAKKVQLKFMNPALKELMNKDTRVVIDDGVLKLFAVDRREEYMKRWMEVLKKPDTL